MTYEYTLLAQMNYREKPGYKVNLLFPGTVGMFFGFNANRDMLRTIVHKAQYFIDTDKIERNWTSRSYDYLKTQAEERVLFLSVLAAALLLAFGGFVVLFIKSARAKKVIEKQALALAAVSDELQEASRAKSEFLAQMSHEIRTPINTITGMTELALRENIPEKVREYALLAKQAGKNILVIIDDILDFSKIEAGKLEITDSEYSFVSLFNDIISVTRLRVSDKPIVFLADADCRIPSKLIGDEVRIKQVLLNLLGNAVKYTNEGHVSFTITCDIVNDDAILTAEIADSGAGIKEEDMAILFEQFSRLDTDKNIEGTGLGLAISKKLCEAMDGSISVRSEYGAGSIFTVVIPQKLAAYEKLAEVENPENKPVLVYEPQLLRIRSMERALDGLGVGCSFAASKESFYDALEKDRYAYIFMPSYLFDKEK